MLAMLEQEVYNQNNTTWTISYLQPDPINFFYYNMHRESKEEAASNSIVILNNR